MLNNGILPFEKEELSTTDKYNDYIITSLRTTWGVNLQFVKNKFGNKYHKFIEKKSQELINKNLLIKENNILKISPKGKFIEDNILLDLFY